MFDPEALRVPHFSDKTIHKQYHLADVPMFIVMDFEVPSACFLGLKQE
jgi:hypothetical protein